jgi:hypothetical protein
VETFADVLKLLQVDSLDVDQWVQGLGIESMNRLLREYGESWIHQNRVRLIQELELLNTM